MRKIRSSAIQSRKIKIPQRWPLLVLLCSMLNCVKTMIHFGSGISIFTFREQTVLFEAKFWMVFVIFSNFPFQLYIKSANHFLSLRFHSFESLVFRRLTCYLWLMKPRRVTSALSRSISSFVSNSQFKFLFRLYAALEL